MKDGLPRISNKRVKKRGREKSDFGCHEMGHCMIWGVMKWVIWIIGYHEMGQK